ncbi:DUF1801 domain-containing protein [Candidatus Saccharibacteria bacterium]|nr:DUF1801 domain-containing protein [Candidatus Saccharibacteria bacterium]
MKLDPRIDAYIAAQPAATQKRLIELRAIIQRAFPEAIEDISYKMPAWRLQPKKRPVVFFAVFEKHIGLYAVLAPSNQSLAQAIEPYNTGRGTLRFDHDQPLPTKLIEDVLIDYAKQLHKTLYP